MGVLHAAGTTPCPTTVRGKSEGTLMDGRSCLSFRFSNFLRAVIFLFHRIVETYVSYGISSLYLTCIAAVQLRWPLSNINVIQKCNRYFFKIENLTNIEISEWVTPSAAYNIPKICLNWWYNKNEMHQNKIIVCIWIKYTATILYTMPNPWTAYGHYRVRWRAQWDNAFGCLLQIVDYVRNNRYMW